MTKIINLFGGPGVGKSTTAAALFAEMKYQGKNVELVQEYIKEGVWEGRSEKFFAAQEYIFAKQNWKLSRLIGEVDYIVTDSPLLLSLIYKNDSYPPSFDEFVLHTFNQYDNFNICLKRDKEYNGAGRFQTEKEAKKIDVQINRFLLLNYIKNIRLEANRETPNQILEYLNHDS